MPLRQVTIERKRPSFLRRLISWPVRASGSAMAAINAFVAAYASTDVSRKEVFNTWKPRSATSNEVLANNLTTLVSQARHLDRTTPQGRAVVEGLTADLIGSGIQILPDSGSKSRNERLQDEWSEWATNALVDGSSLWSWQALVVREIATAGAALARFVTLPERLEKGLLPIAILPLEVEWLSEEAIADVPEGNRFIRGIEVDKFCRPVAYHLQNPESSGMGGGERVPADQIIHICEKRRAQQVHGEPVLAVAVERILQDARLLETELKAAVSTAAPAVAITTEANLAETDDDDEQVTDIPAGSVVYLKPDEDLKTIENHRPSQAIKPFRDNIRADIAGGCRVSQYWLDRDPSRANYSSMRLDQLMTKRQMITLKEAIGTGAASKIYEHVFEWLLISLGVAKPTSARALKRFMKHSLRPDQPEYVDPEKDVKASEFAISNNLSTHEIELSSRGKDYQHVFRQRAKERAEQDESTVERIKALQVLADKANEENPSLNLHWTHVISLNVMGKAPQAFAQIAKTDASESADDESESETLEPTPKEAEADA